MEFYSLYNSYFLKPANQAINKNNVLQNILKSRNTTRSIFTGASIFTEIKKIQKTYSKIADVLASIWGLFLLQKNRFKELNYFRSCNHYWLYGCEGRMMTSYPLECTTGHSPYNQELHARGRARFRVYMRPTTCPSDSTCESARKHHRKHVCKLAHLYSHVHEQVPFSVYMHMGRRAYESTLGPANVRPCPYVCKTAP